MSGAARWSRTLTLEEFIFRRIPSVDHLRALLLLHADPARAWEAVEVSGRLYLEPRRVGQVLDNLCESGLITRDGASGGGGAASASASGGPPGGAVARYQFAPQSGEPATLLEEVVAMDRERPVSLIRMIYDRPDSLEAFSDAFRLRRNP